MGGLGPMLKSIRYLVLSSLFVLETSTSQTLGFYRHMKRP